jgi:hypothetical protein
MPGLEVTPIAGAAGAAVKVAKAAAGEINSEWNNEKMNGHKYCTHASRLRTATHRTRRVLFVCLSYLDESSSKAKEWSLVVSCDK